MHSEKKTKQITLFYVYFSTNTRSFLKLFYGASCLILRDFLKTLTTVLHYSCQSGRSYLQKVKLPDF